MRVKKFLRIVTVILCLSILTSTIANASGNMVKLSCKEISNQNISSNSVSTQAKETGKKYSVMLPLIFVHSKATLFSNINGILFMSEKVKVLSNSGFYSYIKADSGEEGYVFSGFLGSVNGYSNSLKIKPFAYVYAGKTSYTKIKVEYSGANAVQWTVSDSSIIDFNEKTGEIVGLKPGVAKITARAGLFNSAECIVSVINKWSETEYAVTNKTVAIKQSPGDSYKTTATISSGTSVVARGDFADGSGWLYVSAMNNIEGFIKVSDFPGIDFLMTQYHYYDQGFNIRFGSASTKIYDYASVLNNVMTDLFNLKVCPYVYSYTSAADQCKIWRYDSVYSNNLASSCPKTDNHKNDSCLKTDYLREDLKNKFENGGGTVSKVAWTGHIMTDHNNDRSNATVGIGTIIITPYKTVHKTSSGYVNDSSYEIRRDNISTLMHETIHQLGIYDHYCYDDQGGPDGKRCSNTGGCYVCYGNGVKPDCMMMVTKYPTEDSVLLCSKCKSNVYKYLSDNF
ncbi:MAG: SH3 domain-containing protein [Clostridia bacterium]|nr:SH3 domain-containing protein [Clostridia bacterium]